MSELLDIHMLVRKLEKASIQNQLPSSFSSENLVSFEDNEIRALVSHASVLSLGTALLLNSVVRHGS
ncbi:hypothetical protein PN41_18065, partial [Vibrio anguillarum]